MYSTLINNFIINYKKDVNSQKDANTNVDLIKKLLANLKNNIANEDVDRK